MASFMELKKVFYTLFLSALTLAGSVRAADNAIAAQYHFAGLQALTNSPNLPALQQIFCADQQSQISPIILSRRWRNCWSKELGLNASGTNSSLLHPVLDDLGRVESAGGFGGNVNEPLAFVLAAGQAGNRLARNCGKKKSGHDFARALAADNKSGGVMLGRVGAREGMAIKWFLLMAG